MDKEIVIKQSLDVNEATKATLQILFSGRLKIYVIIIIAIIGFKLFSQVALSKTIKPADLMSVFVLIAIPLLLILSTRNTVKKKIENFEGITYTINNAGIKTEGKNFFRIYEWH